MAKKRNIEGDRLYHFELSDKNRTVRWVLIGILLAVGAVALIVGMLSALQTPAGWQTLEASSTKQTCAAELVLRYELGMGEQSASVEQKNLELFYGKTAEEAWQLFYNEAGAGELMGIYALNQHPNEEITVDPSLYTALQRLEKAESWLHYLAPVYAAWERVILSENEILAADCDPGTAPEAMAYVRDLMEYVRNSEHISLELRPENRVYLHISREYEGFLQENAVENYLDLGWLKNAAAVDYIAHRLQAAGYTNGYLSSVDGFTRNLDSRGTEYTLNLFADGILGAVMTYAGPMSVVSLRSYPMYQEDAVRYYTFSNGRRVHTYVDVYDGQCRTALPELTAYSEKESCLSLAAAVAPAYITEDFRPETMVALAQGGSYSVWFDGGGARYTQKDLPIQPQDPALTPEFVTIP